MILGGQTWARQLIWLLLSIILSIVLIGAGQSARAADPMEDCKGRYDSTQRGDGTYIDQRYSACERGVTAAIKGKDVAQGCSGFNGDQVLMSECSRAHQYAKDNNIQAPPQAPSHPCHKYDRDADGSWNRRDACKAGYDYAAGDYSKECGDMDVAPLDRLTQLCVEGYNLNPDKKTPYPARTYRRDILNMAPKGYVMPGEDEHVKASKNAEVFCEYYRVAEEERFETEALYLSCIVGYELGFGKSAICTERFLIGPRIIGIPYPNATSEKISGLAHTTRSMAFGEVPALAAEACRDGWNQYKVDYWYCGGDSGCQNSLRTEKKRVIDPGPAPSRPNAAGSTVVNPSLPTPGAIIMQTGTPTQKCGSIQTAYFSCGGGGGDIENSSFWSILQTILTILVVLVGISAVGGLVYGAMRYASAGDSSTQVNEAKNIIKNVIIGLVLFMMMWAIIEYFIPGGIFKTP